MRLPLPAGYEYRVLLAALLAVLVAYPALLGPSGVPVVGRVLLTLLFLAGGWVVFAAHRLWPLAAALGGLAVLGAWTGYTLPDADNRAAAAAPMACTKDL